MSEWHLEWNRPTWSYSPVCPVLVLLLVSNTIISISFPKLCRALSGSCAQVEPSAGFHHFNIQLAELQVYNNTMSIQMMCHTHPLLHHLQPKPLPESTQSEQCHKSNHTFVQENKSKMSPPGYGLKVQPASKYLCFAQPSQCVLNQASAKSRKQGSESN